MAKLDYSKIFIKDACPTSIGGQAVMEGVMMQGPDRIALAMRLPSGELYLKTKAKPKDSVLSKAPLIRGVVAFVRSLVMGMSTLMDSADILERFAPEEYLEKPGKFEQWMDRNFGKRAMWNLMMTISVLVAAIITIVVFIIFPTAVVNVLQKWITNAVVLNLVEGLLRIILFVLYVLAIRRMKDIKTLFQYHGAEHKSIHCFENNRVLTPAEADMFPTLHPRCGTSFLVFVLIISLLLFSLLGWPNLILRIVSRLVLIPVIAGVSYELLRWAGRSDGAVVRILSYPGLMLQKLTTAEPDMAQLEVGLLALKAVLVDPSHEFIEGFVDKDGNLVNVFRESDFLENYRHTDDLGKTDDTVSLEKIKKAREEHQEKKEAEMEEQSPEIKEFWQNWKKRKERDEEEAAAKLAAEATGAEEEIEDAPLNMDYTIVMDKDYIPDQAIYDYIADEIGKPKSRRYDNDPRTIQKALKWGESALGMVPNGKNEAMMILNYATGLTRTDIVIRGKELMREEDFLEYEKRIQQRLTGTPLQYILGTQYFMGLPFRVNPSVLIPRMDTEVLVLQVLDIIRGQHWKNAEILDMCTGSGAIGVSVASKVPDAVVTMTDASADALNTAMSNAGLNGVNRRCIFLLGDMFDALPEGKKYNMIISNPPYIAKSVIETLATEVKDYEPRMALDGGEDGLDFYRRIAEEAHEHMTDNGILALEIGANQGKSVPALLEATGHYGKIAVIKDLAGLDRVVMTVKK